MATNFPENLDVLVNPQPSDSVAVVSHAAQHTNANDAIEALQAKVGVNNSAVTTSLDYRVKALETASLDAEGIQDIAAALITNGVHSNITVSYSDDTNPPRINLSATYGDEAVMDAIATALTAGTGILKTYDDNANTITLSVDTSSIATQSYVNTAIANLIDAAPGLLDTLNEIAAAIGDDANFATTVNTAITNAISTANQYTDTEISELSTSISQNYVPNTAKGQATGVATLGSDGFIPASQLNIAETIQDTAALMITSATHQGIVVSYDDNTGRLSFTAEALTAEVAQDFIAPLLVHALHTNITALYDDANNKIILESSGGGGGSGTGGSLTNSWWLGA